MNFKEKLIDAGLSLVGRGAGDIFEKEISNYEKAHGVSPEEATKAVFFGRARNLQLEIGANGIIDTDSVDFKGFKIALGEVFGKESLDKFSEDANDPAIYRPLTVPPSNVAEVKRIQNHFSGNFEGKIPDFGTCKESSDNMKVIDALLRRFSGDPRLSVAGSMESIVAALPEIGADLGKILEAKAEVERAERLFGKDLKFASSVENFKKTAWNSVTEMLWGAPIDCFGNLMKTVTELKRENYFTTFMGAFVKETTQLAGREVLAGTKILARLTHTTGSFVKNKIIR